MGGAVRTTGLSTGLTPVRLAFVTRAAEIQINRGRGLVWLLHVFALLLSAFCFGYGVVVYDSLPDPLPTHWGPGGIPDDWSPKSFGSVFFGPLMGAGLSILLALITAAVSRIAPPAEDASPWKLYVREGVNRGTVAALGSTSILLAALFGFFAVAGWLAPDHLPLWPVITLTALILGVIPVSYASASRWARRTAAAREIVPTESETEDEKLWVAGVLYNNPADPHVLVPKRSGTGLGLTVNVGNRKGRIAVAVFLAVFVILPLVLGVVLAL
jgi:uncharacterized membrane protein